MLQLDDKFVQELHVHAYIISGEDSLFSRA